MLKEIKKEKDVITNQDLFNEIIKKIKESGKWPFSMPKSFLNQWHWNTCLIKNRCMSMS